MSTASVDGAEAGGVGREVEDIGGMGLATAFGAMSLNARSVKPLRSLGKACPEAVDTLAGGCSHLLTVDVYT